MTPGPPKSFDPSAALLEARDVFWRLGYDGTGIRDLEEALGIGRKSLYDTFGNKRALYLRSLDAYADTVIARICARLDAKDATAFANLERVLGRLQRHHASEESLGCLLGVAMGQADAEDDEVAAVVARALRRVEDAFERALRRGVDEGSVRALPSTRDVARQLVALTQGMALMGRVHDGPTPSRSVVRATLALLRA